MKQDETDFWVHSVRQENYAKFGAKIDQYKEEKKYTDLTIICRDERAFRCHCLILAAVSEYFERILFEEGDREINATRILILSDTDSTEFEYIMQCAYKDEVLVNDENVLILLRLSHKFEIATLENWCTRYLTERNVPVDDALELFAFVRATRNTVLVPVVARFILNHLREFARGQDGLLRISCDDMKALVAHRRTSSRRRENELFNVLSHWMSHSMSQQLDRESFLSEILPSSSFKHVSPVSVEQQIVVQSSARESLSLHMYAENSDPLARQLFSFAKNSEGDLTLCSSPRRIMCTSMMKIVAVDEHLYSYFFQGETVHHGSTFTFGVSASADLHDRRTLKLPDNFFPHSSERMFNDFDFEGLSTCSDPIGHRIYLSCYFPDAPVMQPTLYEYNCEIDRWYPFLSDGTDLKQVNLITYCDSRLYAIESSTVARAFDSRSGKWDTLLSTTSTHHNSDACCCHKGKIYLSCDRVSKDNQMMLEVYDPVAGRWSVMTPSPASKPIDDVGWLASFADRLWMFGIDRRTIQNTGLQSYNYRKYDSFLQKWDEVYSLPIGERDRSVIIDITVFK